MRLRQVHCFLLEIEDVGFFVRHHYVLRQVLPLVQLSTSELLLGLLEASFVELACVAVGHLVER